MADGEIVFPRSGRAADDTVAGVPDMRVRSISAKLDRAEEAARRRTARDGRGCGRHPAVGVGGNSSSW